MKKASLYFAAAGVILAASWLLYFFLFHNPLFQWLFYIGWAILAIGLILIFLPMFVLRSKSRVAVNKSFIHTRNIVKSGIYSVVRHPLYLGWLLMYVAVIFFSQHWLVMIPSAAGIVFMYLICRNEDRDMIAKFGRAYENYMKSVPSINIFSGIIRLLCRSIVKYTKNAEDSWKTRCKQLKY